MEPATSKILITLGLKVVTPVLKLAKSKLEKDLFIYTILRNKNIKTTVDSDFNSVYLETLYQLISVQEKSKKIIALFEIDEVKKALNEEVYKNNNWTFKVNLDSNLHTNPNLRQLKNITIDLDKEIEDFKKVFKEIINTTREPKEVEQYETIKKIKEEVSELIDTKGLNTKFKTDVEISNQILFSKSEIQPLSEHISKRDGLIDSLFEKYTTNGWIAIDGSISTGKSQLSVLMSQKVSSNIFWINLREFTSTSFLIKIFTDLSAFVSVSSKNELDSWLSAIFDKIESGSLIVLDDLPKLDFRSQAFSRFISFLKVCKEKNILLLSTSNFELPIQIKDYINDGYIHSLKLPFLLVEDVYEVILSYGVLPEKADQYKTLVHSLSTGHPIIVKAICEYLVQINWELSSDELSVIFSGDYSLELNESTYDILTKTVADETTRNLLYRLNVFIGSFTIDEVRLIGDCSPEISNLIERFNSSVGIWIQKRDSSRFEVSPLLKKLKTRDLSKSLEKQLNYTLGKNILDKKSLNQFDAQKAITYFIAAKSFNDAGFVLTLVLNEALKNPVPYFEWGINLYWYTTKLPDEMDLTLQLYIRTLQITLNSKKDNNLSFLVDDLENICSVASKKGINVGPAYLLLSTHYSAINSKKALNFLMTGNDQYNALIQTYGDKEGLKLENNFEAMIWAAVVSIDSIESIDHWFSTISGLTEEQLQTIRDSENIDFGSIFIFKNLREKEEKKDEKDQNWFELIDIFKHIQEQAKALNLELINANAIRYIINIYSERLDAIDDALSYAKEFIDTISDNKTAYFLINDAIGRQLFYFNRIDEATPYIATAVDIEVDEFYTEKLDTYLVISQILGIKDSKIALHYSSKANEFAKENEFTSDILQAKVIGELATSYFLDGDMKNAIYKLEKGYQILLDSYNVSPEFHVTIMRYGHVLNYWKEIYFKGKPPEKDMLGGDYEVPKRGMFLSHYKNDLVEEYYFAERRFIVSLLFLNCFEAFGDLELSKKWANNNILISNSFDFNYFSLMLNYSIPYLIIDKKYVEAINLQFRIISDTNKLAEEDYDHERLSKNEFLKSIIEDRPKQKIKEFDEPIIEHVFIPILLNYVASYSDDLKQFTDNISELSIILDELKSIFRDKAIVDSLENIFNLISTGENKSQAILETSDNYKGDFESALKLICYLFNAVYSEDLEAFKYHFAIVNRLTTVNNNSKGTFNFIIIPFFKNFWFNRIEKKGSQNKDFWDKKSKPYYESVASDNKVKCLFKIISHHLDYETTSKEDGWMDF
ncbi:hypothetical protein GCQ56_19925 [Marinifilum sp. N1E240]|uniref:hypothetical protein n=1 Tax=Marinifilum sp. N1E240 TaxID=2608082 RepID=UPI00128DDA99|nr:hypothetical protein [Marinifilum sp. N1E240]MPQ49275.1 hypothetical protein [Marinifilum sp. N1E240]